MGMALVSVGNRDGASKNGSLSFPLTVCTTSATTGGAAADSPPRSYTGNFATLELSCGSEAPGFELFSSSIGSRPGGTAPLLGFGLNNGASFVGGLVGARKFRGLLLLLLLLLGGLVMGVGEPAEGVY